MAPFTTLDAVAVAIPIANVDTDMLVPSRFLKTISREGLAEALFHNLRSSDAAFPLNLPPWNRAGILIALDNFGCGSSREHAPWALLDFGIRCVIAPGFAEIFHQNCFKNGILPIVLESDPITKLMARVADPQTARMRVSLVDQTIVCGDLLMPFHTDPERRERLLAGLDDIALSLQYDAEIAAHESRSRDAEPWLRAISVGIA